jgi:hypothetical protein
VFLLEKGLELSSKQSSFTARNPQDVEPPIECSIREFRPLDGFASKGLCFPLNLNLNLRWLTWSLTFRKEVRPRTNNESRRMYLNGKSDKFPVMETPVAKPGMVFESNYPEIFSKKFTLTVEA